MRTHVVRQGEYLSALAFRYGFEADAIWNLSANRELRARRPNREVLLPGDLVRLPEPTTPGRSFSSGSCNRYRAEVPTTTIRIRLQSESAPHEGEPFVVEGVGAEPIVGTTGADGLISFEAPLTLHQCLLRLPQRGAAYPVMIGHMDPHDEPSGVAARLEHLGFSAPDLRQSLSHGPLGADARRATIPERRDDHLTHAIRAFQAHAGIPETGLADVATMDALRRAHDGDD